MKQKDFAMILIVVVISAVLSVVISGSLITTPEDRRQTVETASPISTTFDRPPADYFNKDSVNPTQTIEIGEDPNTKPFSED